MTRFTDTNDGIYDNQEKRMYKISAYEYFDCETDEVVDLLNEQQSTINKLKKENEQLRQRLNRFQVSLNYWQKLYRELYEKKG